MTALERLMKARERMGHGVAHTPTPWLVSRDDDECPVIVVETGDGAFEQIVCDLFGTLEAQEANAAHIVLCVNAHDELVTALRDARRALSVAIRSAWEGSTDADVAENHVVKKIDLALSKSGTSTEGGAR